MSIPTAIGRCQIHCHSAGNLFRACNISHAGKFFRASRFFRAGRTFRTETPYLPRNLRIRSPGIHPARFPLSPLAFPWLFPNGWLFRLPRNGRYPQTRGVVTPPSELPETSASLTRVSAVVTGMFHTLQSITIRPRRTPYASQPDSPLLKWVLSANNSHFSLG